ncbi:cation:proton antiporter [Nocardia sp. NPDC020380]|uniref:cation:proton antiporter n=1 Tax=Nocardia sp. NPDC020380 TaxID=3364309 RepID=UPI0037AFDD3F
MTSPQIALLLADIAAIIVLAAGFGALARRLGQPAVIGEVAAGLLLGPTVLGSWSATLFPGPVRFAVQGLAQIAVVLFMFGLGLESGRGRRNAIPPQSLAIAAGATVLPLAVGMLLTLGPVRAAPGYHGLPAGFTVFVGVALAITAFPVLARILIDAGLYRVPLGRMALASAAASDVIGWLLLAVAIALAGDGHGPWQLLWLAPYLVVLMVITRVGVPRMYAWAAAYPRRRILATSLMLSGVLASGAVTEAAGLNLIFGAFLLGLLSPSPDPVDESQTTAADSASIAAVVHEHAHRVGGLLLPLFFVAAGLNVNLRLHAADIAELLLIVATACAGKLIGGYLAARLTRIPARSAMALAILLNTRGLTELIALTAGLQLGIINQRLYSLLVCMALITTLATGPLLRWILRGSTAAVDLVPATTAA